MPKRGAISAFLTAIAVALLINFKTPSQQGLAAFTRQTTTGTQSTSGSAVASGSATASGSPLPSASAQPTAAATPATQTLTGPAVSYFFGTAQVQVTMVNGHITDVTALQLPNEGQSAWISQQVEPMLKSEVLSAQSAQINLISGATYTSEAYAQSLQGALDQARA
ncbi:MAG: FMN-binding protein [Candidatus Limnocylindria bacterium]